jgi:hypothetical protein
MSAEDVEFGQLSGLTYECPDGGQVHIPKDAPCQTAGSSWMTPVGTGLGPLDVSAYPNSTASIGNVSYLSGDGGYFDHDWGGADDGDYFGAAGGAATAGAITGTTARQSRDEPKGPPRCTRREAVRSALTIAAVGGLAGNAAAESQTLTKTAAANIKTNPSGLKLRVLDTGASVLPADMQYYALVNDMNYSRFRGGPEDAAELPPTLTGGLKLATKPGLLAGVKATLGKKALSYSFSISQSPSELAPGESIALTDHPFVVDGTLKAGAGNLTLTIGGTSVPHYEESADSAKGYYRVREGAVIYRAGSKTPSGTEAELVVYEGTPQETLDDLRRKL